MIWVIAYFLLGGLIFLGLGVWASLIRKEASSDGFLLSITDLSLLVIWPLAIPLMLKEMFSEAPAIPSKPKPLVERDSMIGSAGVAATDLRPSGKIIIEGQVFEAIAILGVIARGTKVEVVDRDDLQMRVRVWPS
jgi:membrane-bound ClpP family serine protease